MDESNLPALKLELTNDPAAIGYAAVIKDHVAIAKLINRSDRQVGDLEEKPNCYLFDCFDEAELLAAEAVPVKLRRLNILISMPLVSPSSNKLRQSLVLVFGDPSKTLTRFDKWRKRTGTRAEELGFGRVTETDVSDALLRT